MIEINSSLNTKIARFLKRLNTSFGIEKPSKKLSEFHKHDFKTFLAELKKKKVPKLSLSQQDEWEEYVETYQKEINDISEQIKNTDSAIDALVYQLYELTPDEIRIIEETV